MNSCLTSPVSRLSALFLINYLVILNKDNALGFPDTPVLFHSVQCAYLKNGTKSGTHSGRFDGTTNLWHETEAQTLII
jgi:hypothetical protein